jgi:hypothetical protein
MFQSLPRLFLRRSFHSLVWLNLNFLFFRVYLQYWESISFYFGVSREFYRRQKLLLFYWFTLIFNPIFHPFKDLFRHLILARQISLSTLYPFTQYTHIYYTRMQIYSNKYIFTNLCRYNILFFLWQIQPPEGIENPKFAFFFFSLLLFPSSQRYLSTTLFSLWWRKTVVESITKDWWRICVLSFLSFEDFNMGYKTTI